MKPTRIVQLLSPPLKLLFGKGRGDGVAVATSTTHPGLLATLDQVCGPAGTAWTTPATELTEALTATGHFLDLGTTPESVLKKEAPN